MNMDTLAVLVFGAFIGMIIVISCLAQWARPKVRRERISALKHHTYELLSYLSNRVADARISPEEAELILRVSLVAVCRGNKKHESYLHHVRMEAMTHGRDY